MNKWADRLVADTPDLTAEIGSVMSALFDGDRDLALQLVLMSPEPAELAWRTIGALDKLVCMLAAEKDVAPRVWWRWFAKR